MQIVNSLKSATLDVTELTDPVTIEAYKQQVADQMNAQSGGPTFEDLSHRLADIVIQTSAQGASMLEVHVIDPMWTLLISGFIQVDESGFLWPPIDVNFPKDASDQVWRLVQCRASSDLTEGNLILTFEDRIAAELRDVAGPEIANPNETLGGFIKRLVDQANQRATGQPAQALDLSGNAAALGPVNVPRWKRIRLVELIAPDDPNYTAPVSQPASTNLPASPARQDANKPAGGVSQSQQDQLAAIQQGAAQAFGISPGTKGLIGGGGPTGGPLTMSEIEQNAAAFFRGVDAPQSQFRPGQNLGPGRTGSGAVGAGG